MKPESEKTAINRRRNNGDDSAFDLSRLKGALDAAADRATTDDKNLRNPEKSKNLKKSSFDLSALSAAITAVHHKETTRRRRIRRRQLNEIAGLGGEAARSLMELLLLPAGSGVVHVGPWISSRLQPVQVFGEPDQTRTVALTEPDQALGVSEIVTTRLIRFY